MQEPKSKDKKRKSSKSDQRILQSKIESKDESDEVLQMSPSPKKKHKNRKSSEGVTSGTASPPRNDNAGKKKANKRKSQTSSVTIDKSEPHNKESKTKNQSV